MVTPTNTPDVSCYLDMHESYLTDQGTLIASAYNVTQTDLTQVGEPAAGWIFDSIFYIPLSDSEQPLTLYDIEYGKSQASPWDYFHINSVQPLLDGYLVNSRLLSSMFKVSMNGSIEWRLSGLDGGDFTLDPDVYFSWQHEPRVSKVTASSMYITLFNNDNSAVQNVTNSTTGLELYLDLQQMHVSLARRLQNTSQPIYALSQGSYQPLEQDHALMGYGQIATTREYDADGKVFYQAKYGYSNATSPVASYRSFKQVWAGQPSTPPKVGVVCGKGGNGTVYMSCNGATTYTSRTISAGNSSSILKPVGMAARAGFETSYMLGSG